VYYRLTIADDAEDGRYEIAEESEYQGDDILLCTDDVEEVVSWITGRIALQRSVTGEAQP